MNTPPKAGKAAIVIDRWKLPIVTRHLKEAGFSYEEVGALTDDSLTLTVQYTDLHQLKLVVAAAMVECKRSKS